MERKLGLCSEEKGKTELSKKPKKNIKIKANYQVTIQCAK